MSLPAPVLAAGQPPRRIQWVLKLFRFSENSLLITLSILLGLTSGLAAVAFHWLIEGTRFVATEWASASPGSPLGPVRVVLAPAAGGLLAGLLIWLLARRDHGHGTSSVMEAVALRGGRLAARPILTKVVAAGVLIGAGGSAGPEDPSVQIGSVFGSVLGQRLHLSDRLVKMLVTTGVASAIAAAFNAPIAGVFFALEIVAGEFSTTMFAPVVLGAVAASVVSRALLGSQPAFLVPGYSLVNPLIEAPLYALLGVCAAALGTLFIRAVFRSEELFHRVHAPILVRASAGGVIVGLIGLLVPGALSVSYDTAGGILSGHGPFGLGLLLLLGAKFLATAITLGAAEVGGTFAPSLVMGAMLGGLFGQLVESLLPGLTAPPAAYALVAMGAVLTAVVRAPITAVLLLFEVTADYRIILPIMISVVLSELFAHRLHPESIYTERLARAGIQLRFGRDLNILEVVTVGEAMTPDFTTVPHDMTIADLDALFDSTRHHGFPILGPDGRLSGMVTLSDLEHAVEGGLPPQTSVDQIATHDLRVIYPDQSLNAALRQFAQADVGRLPVVDRSDTGKLLGVLRRNDVVKAYSRGATRRAEAEQRMAHMRAASQSGTHVVEIEVLPGSAADRRSVRDLRLPVPAVTTAIRRNGQTVLAQRDTIVYAGDSLLIMVAREQAEALRAYLTRAERSGMDTAPHYEEFTLPPHTAADRCTVAELALPRDVLIVALRHNGHTQTVHGGTRLAAGDELTVLATTEAMQQLRHMLADEPSRA